MRLRRAPLSSAWLTAAGAASYQHFVVRRQLRRSEDERTRYRQAIHFVTHEMKTVHKVADRVVMLSRDVYLLSGPHPAAAPDRRTWRVGFSGRSQVNLVVRQAQGANVPAPLVLSRLQTRQEATRAALHQLYEPQYGESGRDRMEVPAQKWLRHRCPHMVSVGRAR